MAVIGSGPGGLQIAYFLARLGVEHIVLSADERPGGMFCRFPIFQRLISWTRPFASDDRRSTEYERHDWNSLLADEPAHRALVGDFMDGSSYFPSRAEMERGLAEFASRTGIAVRYGCKWESTSRMQEGFVLHTNGGDIRARVVIVAVGMTEPWKPDIPGIEHAAHYADVSNASDYAGKEIVIIGKRNSAFEIADGLLPWARRLVLVSPRPAQTALTSYAVGAVRARYLQPYEDHVLGGGTFLLNAAIERVDRDSRGCLVAVRTTATSEQMTLRADEVVAATGFTTPLRDLPAAGVATFNEGRLPVQTPLWESATVPGVFFAGSITQGSPGIAKYGIPSSSGAVHGFRHNARVLAAHVARSRLGMQPPRPRLDADEVVPFLIRHISGASELWNQKSYLARVVTFDESEGAVDDGVWPLAHFLDSSGPDAVAVTVEIDDAGEIRPAVYIRGAGPPVERLLPSHPELDFATQEHARELELIIDDVVA